MPWGEPRLSSQIDMLAMTPRAIFLMAKLPFMKWYPADWIKDTRHLSLQAKGAWADLINFMWVNESGRGQYSATPEALARTLGCSQETCKLVIDELRTVAEIVTTSDGNVTVMSRRIKREESIRENNRFRKQRNRVTLPSREIPREKLEVRSQKAEVRRQKTESLTPLAESQQTPLPHPPSKLIIPDVLQDLELYRNDVKLCNKLPIVMAAWQSAYPGVMINAEIRKAHAWEVGNPSRRKKDRLKFLTNWLNRAQDRGGQGAGQREVVHTMRKETGYIGHEGDGQTVYGKPDVPTLSQAEFEKLKAEDERKQRERAQHGTDQGRRDDTGTKAGVGTDKVSGEVTGAGS